MPHDAPTGPVPPDASYLAALNAEVRARAEAAEPISSPHTGAAAGLVDAVQQAAAVVEADAVALARELHARPETAFQEHHSVAAVAELVRAYGVDATVGVFGLDTALRAECGSGDRTVAVLAEYDALPGLGHGCGHNIICAAAVGAFLALAGCADRLPGRVLLLGTPAEEGGGGKELMARSGAFDDVDAALMCHPFGYDVAVHPFLGRRRLDVRYEGVAAHASSQPFMGRNALDAATLCYQGAAMLRQHLPPGDRIHGVIVEGGQRPNVVPDEAVVRWYLRSQRPETLRDLSARMAAVAAGAATMTGCGVAQEWDPQPSTLPVRHNQPLAARWALHQARCGRRALPPGVVPESLAASTDFGNVSVRVPSIHPMIAVADPGVALHTAEFAGAAGSPAGERAVSDGAVGLALTAVDYLADPELQKAVATEFDAAGGRLNVADYFEAAP